MKRRVHPLLATALALLSLGLAAAPGASAAQVQPVSIQACAGTSGCSLTSSVRVDDTFGLIAAFKVTNTISSGNSIFVELPPGHEFVHPVNVTISWKSAGYSAPGTSVSNENRRLQIPIPSWLEGPITSANGLELNIGLFNKRINVPATPGSFNVNVWTSADVDPRTSSNSITTTVGLPSSLSSSQTLTATAGGSLSAVPSARLTDSRGNPVPNEDVTFTLPADGPGGTFEGGGTSSSGKTDSEGYASPALPITADSEAGSWEISLSGPNSTTGTINVNTSPAAAEEIELELSDGSLPADGTSTATATIRVLDEFGNLISGDDVSLETGGGPSATTPVQLDGSFTSTLTTSTTPGEFTITAKDTSVNPAVTETATFTQTELPPTDIELSLEPASIVADGNSTTTVVATVEDEIGGGVAGEDVVFESDGGNQVGPTVDNGDGTYSAVVTSTTTVGDVTITATDESVDPTLSATAKLTQTAVPPPSLPTPLPGPPQGQGPKAGAPATGIRSGPKGKTRARKVKFTFVAPGATGFQCRLDKGPWKACTSPARYTVAPGAHVFRVRALGSDGKPGPVAKRSFKRLPPKR